jgi:hypothetical protein
MAAAAGRESGELVDRDPDVTKLLSAIINRMRDADGEFEQLKAVEDGGRQLEPYDDDDAIGHLSDMAIQRFGLDADVVTTLIGRGLALGRKDREESDRGANGRPTSMTTVKSPRPAEREWPDPCPLPEALLPVAAFDFEMLPEKLRPWAADIAERMQCPPDYIGASIMVALSSVIGSKIVIRPKSNDDWQVVTNQWALIIGRPGVLKSPAMEEGLKPLRKLCADANREFEKAKAGYDLDQKIAELQVKEAIKKAGGLFKKNNGSADDTVRRARDLLTENPHSPEAAVSALRHRGIRRFRRLEG